MAYPIDLRAIDEATFSLLIDHASHEALVESTNGELQVLLRGRLYTARVEDERASRLTPIGRRAARRIGRSHDQIAHAGTDRGDARE